ncbi:MAG: leucine-rich repeat domain-containing protein [Alphaproteobacteria bacterium]|nr:leucine-rich repeat domain-containing protein [Alphaproteobacteria bacterium]MCB9797605.1 leucine-rich repeat domain-containing protein [Alphaproteobacteria bacterium]
MTDRGLTPADAEALHGLPLHPQVRAWLESSAGQERLRGAFTVNGAARVPRQGLPLAPWTKRFGEDFPALSVGSDGYGHEFWVHVSSAQVISAHHDSLDEAMVGLTLPADKDAATARVLSSQAALDLDTLLALHRALEDTHDDPVATLHGVCEATGWAPRHAAARLDGEAALAFLWIRARDLLEDGDLSELIAARETLTALREDPASLKRKRKLSLAEARLRALPEAIAALPGVKGVDLRGNPGLDWDAAFALLARLPKLEELSLAGCRLRQVPEGLSALPGLRKLDLSGNPLASLPEMPALSALQQITLKDTPLDDASLIEAFRATHPDCVALLARPLHPAGLGRAFADPENAEVVDLSAGYSDDDALVTELPALARLPRLRVLRLAGQRQLTLPQVLRAIEGTQLEELDLRQVQASSDDDLSGLFAQRELQVLRLRGKSWSPPDPAKLLRYAAGQPKLRVLECLRGDQPLELPATQLEALTLLEAHDPYDEAEPPLPALPRGLHRQARLHTLHASGHRVVVPRGLGHVPALRHLMLTATVHHPERLSEATGLESLELHQDRMQGFPDLRALKGLRRLVLRQFSADIDALSAQLGALESLEELELNHCGLRGEHLAAVGQARGLKKLLLHEQYEQHGPLALGGLTQLRDLELLNVYPSDPTVLALPSLRRLRWHGVEGPSEARLLAITENRDLEDLQILDHGLRRLPAQFAQLTRLRRLSFCAWRELKLDKQPEVWGDMSQLVDLELGGLSGTRLPESLLGLPLRKLRITSMEDLKWPQVFQQLARVPSLRELEICWGRCESIPPEIAGLQGLTQLMVHQSRLKSVAKEIAGLKGLQRLQITVNPLASGEGRRVRKWLPWCEVLT